MHLRLIHATLALCLGAGTAAAVEPYPYAGAVLAFGEAEFPPTLNPPVPNYDETDATMSVFRGFGGYRFNDYFAVEGAIVGAANDDEDLEPEVTFGALSVSAMGVLPVAEGLELFGRIGAFFGESEVEFPGEIFSDSEDESGIAWGLGALYSFGARGQFTARAEFEAYETDELDELWAVGLGFQYNFR